MDKYKLGDPIQTKKTKWKGYIAYIYDEENFRISCAGYPTFSHTSNRHIDEIEPRKMPRSEINIQQQFRALVEHGAAVPASIVRELRKSISSSKENQEHFNKRRLARVKEFKAIIDAQAKEIEELKAEVGILIKQKQLLRFAGYSQAVYMAEQQAKEAE